MIYCQRNLKNRGLSGLKNICLVIMTGDLLPVVFSPMIAFAK